MSGYTKIRRNNESNLIEPAHGTKNVFQNSKKKKKGSQKYASVRVSEKIKYFK